VLWRYLKAPKIVRMSSILSLATTNLGSEFTYATSCADNLKTISFFYNLNAHVKQRAKPVRLNAL